jgi:two-component system, LytTR family, sensor kinase
MKQHHLKTYRDWLLFNDVPMMIIGIPLLAFVTPVLFFGAGYQEGLVCVAGSPLASVAYPMAYWLGDRQIVIFFRKKYPEYKHLRKRLIWTASSVVAYTVIIIAISGLYQVVTQKPIMEVLLNVSPTRKLLGSLTATFIVLMMYESVYFLNLWKSSMLEAERLKKEQIKTQLDALKTQVNPHFLFNSLNTLISLIPEDQQKAVDFTQKLSHVYRTILELNDRSAITLKEEMKCVHDFLFLIKTRFSDSFSYTVHIPKECETLYVVPLAVQMLVENAIKHNIVANKKPLQLNIGVERGMLKVSNNLQLRNDLSLSDKTRQGTGLNNIETRYRLLFDHTVQVVADEHSFQVYLPLISILEK